MKHIKILILAVWQFAQHSQAQSNWTDVKLYDNDGNVMGQSRTYTDAIGRTIQQQSLDIANGNVLVSQPVFDAFGRPVLQTLAAPLFQNTITAYKDKFIEDASGNNYSWDDFDKPNMPVLSFGAVNKPNPVKNTTQGSVGWYYSNNNSSEPYVPSSSYPYSRIEYFNDPLGRVKRSSMAGENQRMGSGHENRAFYLNNAGELYYIFGYYGSYTVGFEDNSLVSTGNENMSAFKTIQIDEDGKESVVYTNSSGQVIATCMTGIASACTGQKVRQTMYYKGQRGLSIHLPASKKNTLTLITANTGYGIVSNEGSGTIAKQVNYAITDLNTGKLLVDGTDYTINRSTRLVTFKNGYQNGSSFFRISFEYTASYLNANFDMNNEGSLTKWDPKFIPNLAISYELDYSNWSINYYTKKGELAKTVSPALVDCSFNPLAGNTVTMRYVEKPLDPTLGSHSELTTPVAGFDQTLQFNVKLFGTSTGNSPSDIEVRVSTIAQGTTTYNVSNVSNDAETSTAYVEPGIKSGPTTRGPNVPTPDGQLKYEARVYFDMDGTLVQGGSPSITNGSFTLETNQGQIKTISLNSDIVKNYTSIRLYITQVDILVYKYVIPNPTVSNYGFYQLDRIEPFDPSNTIHTTRTNNLRAGITTKLEKYPKFTPVPDANLVTYAYNALGWPIKSSSPDEGTVNIIYDTEGKVRFKQNAQQLADGGLFSYFVYDRAGRVVETGEFNPNLRISGPVLSFQPYTLAGNPPNPIVTGSVHAIVNFTQAEWLAYANHCTQQTWFAYDKPQPDFPATLTGYSQRYQDGQITKSWNNRDAAWFGYDDDGRNIWVVHTVNDLGLKTVNYYYTKEGRLDKIDFQKEIPAERFVHQYFYDANKRLIETKTSLNNTTFTRQQSLKYYLHGAIKRNELGGTLQGIDYVYTINGQLKSVNDPTLTNRDPGKDSFSGANAGFKKDVFGFTLDYFPRDYVRKNTYIETYAPGNVIRAGALPEPYNGNIRAMRWQTALPTGAAAVSTFTSGMLQYLYKYDSQNQLSEAIFGAAKAGSLNGPTTGTSPSFTEEPNAYRVNNLTYDKTGNVQTLKRQGKPTALPMDDLKYNYHATLPNRLTSVSDIPSSYTDDLKPQSVNNYGYNGIGQLIKDVKADYNYTYNPAGNVTAVTKSDGSFLLRFEYNNAGLRQKKIIYDNNGAELKHIWYVYGSGSDLMSMYETNVSSNATIQTELPLYGKGRIGLYDKGSSSYVYELSDHLGNVRATVRNNAGNAEVVSFADYYPHGSVMPGRNFSNPLPYRFGYQGQEKDVETGFSNFELRQYDGRLGRWFNPDPMGQYHSPYLAMGNNPVNMMDETGGWDSDWLNSWGWVEGENGDNETFNDSWFQAGGPNYGSSSSGFADVDAPRTLTEERANQQLEKVMSRNYSDTYDVSYYANQEDFANGENGTFIGNYSSLDVAFQEGGKSVSDPCPLCKFLNFVGQSINGPDNHNWERQRKTINYKEHHRNPGVFNQTAVGFIGKYGGNTQPGGPITYTARRDYIFYGTANQFTAYTITVTNPTNGTLRVIRLGVTSPDNVGNNVIFRGQSGDQVQITLTNATGYWNFNATEKWTTNEKFKILWFPLRNGW